jgi:hypothetical protein
LPGTAEVEVEPPDCAGVEVERERENHSKLGLSVIEYFAMGKMLAQRRSEIPPLHEKHSPQILNMGLSPTFPWGHSKYKYKQAAIHVSCLSTTTSSLSTVVVVALPVAYYIL